MLAVSAYGVSQWVQTPKTQKGNRAFLLIFSGAFAAAGITRAFWPKPAQNDATKTGAGRFPENFPTGSSGFKKGEPGRDDDGVSDRTSSNFIAMSTDGGLGGLGREYGSRIAGSNSDHIGVVGGARRMLWSGKR